MKSQQSIMKTFGFRKTVLATLILLIVCNSVWALKPEISSTRRIILRIEHAHDGLRVCYTAVALGAEMWWWRYYAHIIKYCTPNSSPFYATLPGYGYTLVNATKLANVLFYDQELARRGYTTALRDKLVTAMQNDRRCGAQKQVGDYWDPINDWKWRSVYMENRLKTGANGGNCWGTADYMTKGWEWVRAYPQASVLHHSVFPNVCLDGYAGCCPYYFDQELKRSEFGYADQGRPGILTGYYLNCFDIIRLAWREPEQETDLIITTNNTRLNLGTTTHGEVFLCSDRACKTWTFFQRDWGGPYGIGMLTFKPDIPHAAFHSFFYHKYTNKEVITNIWKENWANVSPVQQ